MVKQFGIRKEAREAEAFLDIVFSNAWHLEIKLGLLCETDADYNELNGDEVVCYVYAPDGGLVDICRLESPRRFAELLGKLVNFTTRHTTPEDMQLWIMDYMR